MNQLDLDAIKQRARAYSAPLWRSERSAASSDAVVNYTGMRGAEFADERNDCSVRAIHMATQLSYAEAHALCAKHGRKRKRGMLYTSAARAAVEAGGRAVQVRARTLGAFLQGEGARGVWMVTITGHFVAIVDGRCVSDSGLSRKGKRIADAFRMPD